MLRDHEGLLIGRLRMDLKRLRHRRAVLGRMKGRLRDELRRCLAVIVAHMTCLCSLKLFR